MMNHDDGDGRRGMEWWNSLTDDERRYWANRAATGVAADAWTLYKKATGLEKDAALSGFTRSTKAETPPSATRQQPAVFEWPSGESVHIWLTVEPVSVWVKAREEGAWVTVSLRNSEEDGVVLDGVEQSLIGGTRPGVWAKLHAMAYAAVSLFDDGEREELDQPALAARLAELRGAKELPLLKQIGLQPSV
jgi:hypothetical protein